MGDLFIVRKVLTLAGITGVPALLTWVIMANRVFGLTRRARKLLTTLLWLVVIVAVAILWHKGYISTMSDHLLSFIKF